MIEDARTIPQGTRIETDICIVGGGSAAIAVAMQLRNSGLQVLMIPGGGPNQTANCIDLYRGKADPPGSHEPLEENRLRMWGGTTTVWGGRCIPFDRVDFANREWVPHSGWPISFETVQPYVKKACDFSEAGDGEFDARSVFPETQDQIISGFDDENFVSWPLERWSVPTDYCKRYRPDLESSRDIKILMHAHAIHLRMDRSASRLSEIDAACSPGKIFTVKAQKYVIACGALENARLLLAARDVAPHGIGNQHDLVGRFYQSHRFGVCGHAVLKDPKKGFIYDFEKDSAGVYCRRRFWLTPEAQEEHRICNVAGFFFRNVSGSSEHRNALVSTVLLAKIFLGGARKGPRRLGQILRDQRREILSHLGIVLKDGPSVFSQLSAVAYTRFLQKRRLPMVLPLKKSNHFPLFYQTEHAPNPDSRILLDESSLDDFGMPRIIASIRFTELDYRTISSFVSLFKKRLELSGLGTFVLSEQEKDFLANPGTQEFNSNSHNIGTTRMSQHEKQGVVDTNCKVHGVDNLYMAGSSVFPTSSHANPTLMIIALALKLGDHLRNSA